MTNFKLSANYTCVKSVFKIVFKLKNYVEYSKNVKNYCKRKLCHLNLYKLAFYTCPRIRKIRKSYKNVDN